MFLMLYPHLEQTVRIPWPLNVLNSLITVVQKVNIISTLTSRDDKCRILHCEPVLVSDICSIYDKRLSFFISTN